MRSAWRQLGITRGIKTLATATQTTTQPPRRAQLSSSAQFSYYDGNRPFVNLLKVKIQSVVLEIMASAASLSAVPHGLSSYTRVKCTASLCRSVTKKPKPNRTAATYFSQSCPGGLVSSRWSPRWSKLRRRCHRRAACTLEGTASPALS